MKVVYDKSAKTFSIDLEPDDIKWYFTIGTDIGKLKETFLRGLGDRFDEAINSKIVK